MRLPADPADLVGVHLVPLVSQGLVPSLAWAVVRGQDVAADGVGGAGPRTIFQIGSVTKVFTALLLADMAERGEVRLSDPAASYLPGRRSLPDGVAPVDPVTLADLATHTSGLPRLPRGLFWSALLNPRDPYARYPASRFVRAARQALRAGAGRSPYVYSNFGYGLLGCLLGQAAGTAYQTLVTTRICVPLGLPDTTYEVPGPSRDRMAQGFQRGRAVPDWHLGALAGVGALYSTATDLARFLQACLAAATTPATSPPATSPAATPAGARDPRHTGATTPDPGRQDRPGLAPHPSRRPQDHLAQRHDRGLQRDDRLRPGARPGRRRAGQLRRRAPVPPRRSRPQGAQLAGPRAGRSPTP
ncbi:MAG: serine hydrolase domain-containing protein [Streptosporangiaceae bacterium]